jgi:epoxyqueuosine reductase QueG
LIPWAFDGFAFCKAAARGRHKQRLEENEHLRKINPAHVFPWAWSVVYVIVAFLNNAGLPFARSANVVSW